MLFAMLVLEAAFVVLLWRTSRALGQAQVQVRVIHASLAEAACLAQALQTLKVRQKKIEYAVDATTDSVETIHRALANLSFDLWGSDGTRQRHDRHAQRVYSGVHGVNRLLGKWAGDWLDSADSVNNRQNKDD